MGCELSISRMLGVAIGRSLYCRTHINMLLLERLNLLSIFGVASFLPLGRGNGGAKGANMDPGADHGKIFREATSFRKLQTLCLSRTMPDSKNRRATFNELADEI